MVGEGKFGNFPADLAERKTCREGTIGHGLSQIEKTTPKFLFKVSMILLSKKYCYA